MNRTMSAPAPDSPAFADAASAARRGPRARRAARIRAAVPKGRMLPDHLWRRRHRVIVTALGAHVPGLFAFGVARGYPVLHALLDVAPLIAMYLLAATTRLSPRWRMVAASTGLVSSSAMLVHLWGGTIEAHFHFFVVIGLLTLYQDWLPFLLAIGYVVLHHGVMGVLEPQSVYSNPNAVASPWRWALIHGAFVLAASATHMASWRTNEQQLLRDALTGLPSRLMLMNRLSSALARLERSGGHVAVLFIDLDRFKIVNDSLGHHAGDTLLLGVTERLRKAVRSHEMLARFGGDEFVLVCEDVADAQHAVAVAERLLKALALPFDLHGSQAFVAGSIGIALTGDHTTSPADLVRDADAAMYHAKEAGGGRWSIFDQVIRDRVVQRQATEAALRTAIEEEQLVVHFQPELDVATAAIVGVEALVRWERPGVGMVSPGDFIPIAEETGLIIPLGWWVLRESCRLAQTFDDDRLVVRVNVSARQLSDASLTTVVAQALADSELPPERLCLEVTESVVMEDAERSIAALQAVRDLGVSIALDDFGTGYSSLSYLRRLPIDGLKIDRSFVRGLGHEAEDESIVASVIDLARSLGVDVTAEGVETAEQHERLRAGGCDTMQGFLFARPQPAADVAALIAATRPSLAA
jgi:diguanylate cyclase (GGDEF)-like protein